MATRVKRPVPDPAGPDEELEGGGMSVIAFLVLGAAVVVAAVVLWDAHAKKIEIAEATRIEELARTELRSAYHFLRRRQPRKALDLVKNAEKQIDALPAAWTSDYADLKGARMMMEAEANFVLDTAGNAEVSEKLFTQALGLITHASGELWLFGVFGRGRARFELRRYGDAIADFDILLARNPSFGSAYYWRSLAHEKLGQSALALADAKRAKSLDAWPPLRDFMRAKDDHACRDYLLSACAAAE